MKAILHWISGPMMSALKPLLHFFATFFSPMVALTMMAYEFVQWVSRTLTGREIEIGKLQEGYEAIKEATAQSVFGAFPPQLNNAISFLNYFFPVTESLVLLGMLSALYVAAVAFRIIKSCIPTVA